MWIKEDNGVKVFNLDEAEWEPYSDPQFHMRRKVFTSANLTWAMSELPVGTHFEETHHHPQEQILHVVQGRMNFECGGKFYDLTPGSIIVIPSDVPHSPNVVGDENVICIEVFTPCRDYPESVKNA